MLFYNPAYRRNSKSSFLDPCQSLRVRTTLRAMPRAPPPPPPPPTILVCLCDHDVGARSVADARVREQRDLVARPLVEVPQYGGSRGRGERDHGLVATPLRGEQHTVTGQGAVLLVGRRGQPAHVEGVRVEGADTHGLGRGGRLWEGAGERRT